MSCWVQKALSWHLVGVQKFLSWLVQDIDSAFNVDLVDLACISLSPKSFKSIPVPNRYSKAFKSILRDTVMQSPEPRKLKKSPSSIHGLAFRVDAY